MPPRTRHRRLYDLLGVKPDATEEQLKKGFHKSALKWHPDRHTDDNAKIVAEEKFKDITKAFGVLSDPARRRTYDELGEDAVTGVDASGGGAGRAGAASSQGGGIPVPGYTPAKMKNLLRRFMSGQSATWNPLDPSDPMNSIHAFFEHLGRTEGRAGGRGGGEAAPPEPPREELPKTATKEFPLKCTLEELFQGKVKKMKVTRKRKRKGLKWGDSSGEEYVDESTTLEVPVRPGMKHGSRCTFASEGDDAPGKDPGDIVFIIEEQPHAVFRRDGADLVLYVELPRGRGKFEPAQEFAGLDGHALHVQTTGARHGEVRILRGEGMPKRSKGNIIGRGDLRVHFSDPPPDEGIDDSVPLEEGEAVVAFGLKGAAELNGLCGRIVGHSGERLSVDFGPLQGVKALKAANLRRRTHARRKRDAGGAGEPATKRRRTSPPQQQQQQQRKEEDPPAHPSGIGMQDMVKAHSLQGMPELNGCVGRVLSLASCSERFNVDFGPTFGVKQIRPQNLEVVLRAATQSEPAGGAARQQAEGRKGAGAAEGRQRAAPAAGEPDAKRRRQSPPAAAAADGPPAVGERVEAHGLSAAGVNGARGTVVEPLQGDRVLVEFPPPLGRKRLRPANLKRLPAEAAPPPAPAAHAGTNGTAQQQQQQQSGPITEGESVTAFGLKGAAELNGLCGRVVGRSGERLSVDFGPPHGIKALKEGNLARSAAAPAAAGSPLPSVPPVPAAAAAPLPTVPPVSAADSSPFPAGAEVEAHSLVGNARLNGLPGVVRGPDPQAPAAGDSRVLVDFGAPHGVKSLSTAKLRMRFVPPPSADGADFEGREFQLGEQVEAYGLQCSAALNGLIGRVCGYDDGGWNGDRVAESERVVVEFAPPHGQKSLQTRNLRRPGSAPPPAADAGAEGDGGSFGVSFEPGLRVEVHSLKGAPELNGLQGTVRGSDENGRILVDLGPHGAKSLSQRNLFGLGCGTF